MDFLAKGGVDTLYRLHKLLPQDQNQAAMVNMAVWLVLIENRTCEGREWEQGVRTEELITLIF